MEIYSSFAQVYDEFINAPYLEWVSYIEEIWKKSNTKVNSVLDLACGTGSISHILSNKGYDTIGIDISEEMLALAQKKDNKTLYLNQDMREFELYGTVDSILCLCDSLNYIEDYKDIEKTFNLVHNYLNPNGLFIFDLNTEHKYKNILANNTFSRIYKDKAYIWENNYDEESKINEYYLVFFTKNQNNTYNRFEEIHYQKAHSIKTIEKALKTANLNLLNIYNDRQFTPPTYDSERIFFIAQKPL